MFNKEEYWKDRNARMRGQGEYPNPVVGLYLGGAKNAKLVGAKATRKKTKRYRKALARQA